MRKFVFIALLLVVVSCASKVQLPPNPFREGTGVWFILEHRKVTAKHVAEMPPPNFNLGWEDIFVGEKKEFKGFEVYDKKIECTMEKPFHRVYFVLPEIGKVEGYIFQVMSEKYICKFDIQIAPGFSGSPVFDFETGKVVGLISAMAVTGPGYEVSIVQIIEPKDVKD